MKYLAFDIEAANGYKLHSICSIGLVAADENFNILWRKNVWINPRSKYNMNGTKNRGGIDLHLDKALLKASPDFRHVYPELKRLFEEEDYFIIGHAVDSDVRMLNAACTHFGCPSLNFTFTCTQLLYMMYKGEKSVRGLAKIADEIGLQFVQHNSEEDAYASLMTLKYLCESTGLTVEELQQKYCIRMGSNHNFELVRPASLAGQVSKRNVTEVAVAKIKEFEATLSVVDNRYQNLIFSMARSIELAEQSVWQPIITAIISHGGKYVSRLSRSNVYVRSVDPAGATSNVREKYALSVANGGTLKIVTVQDVLSGNAAEEQKMTAKQFLYKHGQSVANLNAESILLDYLAEMENGLHGHGSVPMIPTYVRDVDRSKIKSGKRVLIDAGGTNFRSAIGSFDKNGNAVIENLTKTSMPGADGKPLGKQAFYGQIAENLKNIVDLGGDVGFCFSYQVDMQPDVDGAVVCFSKEIHAQEVIGTKVGAETLAAIAKYSSKPRKIAVINDTVATLLGGMATMEGYGGYVGYIYGTGTNLCYVEDVKNIAKVSGLGEGKMLINTESGGFDKIARGDFDVVVANATQEPSRQRLEKMSSGKYLADIIYTALFAAKQEGHISEQTDLSPFELKDVSAFLDGTGQLGIDPSDEAFARELCLELIDRAALLGAIINAGACVKTQTSSLPIAIVAEGTTFYKLPTFKDRFTAHLHELLDKRNISFRVEKGTDLNMVGTLMATMAL